METRFCQCVEFVYWYTEYEPITLLEIWQLPPINVCWCGHPQEEHLDGKHSCVGEVIVMR